jgi:hypothetical protein
LLFRRFFQFARKLLDPLAHDFSSLELDRRTRRDNETASRFIGISSHPWFRQTRLKDSEIPQFDRDVIGQTIGNVIEGSLDDFEDIMLDHSGLIANGDNNIPFG